MVLPLALTILSNLIVALFILVCVGLILIILLQKGRGGGLGAAFGGGGAGSLLGTKTGDFLTWVTISLVAGFLVLAVLMGKFMSGSSSTLDDLLPPATTTEADVEGTAADTAEVVEETAGAVSEEVEKADAAPAEETGEDIPEPPAAETTE